MRTTTAKRPTSHEVEQPTQFAIDELLEELRKYKVLLTYGKTGRVIPWPGKIPLRIRSAISLYNAELKRLIARSDVRTCPSPDLHSWSWDYKVCRECCDVCAHLKPFIDRRAC